MKCKLDRTMPCLRRYLDHFRISKLLNEILTYQVGLLILIWLTFTIGCVANAPLHYVSLGNSELSMNLSAVAEQPRINCSVYAAYRRMVIRYHLRGQKYLNFKLSANQKKIVLCKIKRISIAEEVGILNCRRISRSVLRCMLSQWAIRPVKAKLSCSHSFACHNKS